MTKRSYAIEKLANGTWLLCLYDTKTDILLHTMVYRKYIEALKDLKVIGLELMPKDKLRTACKTID